MFQMARGLERFRSYPPPRCQSRCATFPLGCSSRIIQSLSGALALTQLAARLADEVFSELRKLLIRVFTFGG